MNWTRELIKSNAKLMVKKNWALCAVVSFIMAMIGGSSGFQARFRMSGNEEEQINNAIGNVTFNAAGQWAGWVLRFAPLIAGVTMTIVVLALAIDFFVGNPLRVGGSRFYLHNIHSQGQFGDLGFAFQNQYGNVVSVMLVRQVTILLWSLLLIVPGIIKSYEYRLVPFLLADNPELTAGEALGLSREMMDGEKMNAFVLDLSFILWDMLSSATAGIAGILWVNPYRDATNAELYMALLAQRNGYREQ